MATYYGQGDELHLAFNFPLLHAPWSAEASVDTPSGWSALGALPRAPGPTSSLSNHDDPRHVTRYDDPAARERATPARGSPPCCC